ncbi:MAG TPA: hypothetical protein VIR45_03150, partial [Kiloniellaceae bacterium]
LAERYFMTTLANFHQDWTVFFTRPISATILALAAAFGLWSLYPSMKGTVGLVTRRRRLRASAE